jgi:hypothetical protein
MIPLREQTGKGIRMLRTIQIGTCMSVQGQLVRKLDDGRITIRVGAKLYTGTPVERATSLPEAA